MLMKAFLVFFLSVGEGEPEHSAMHHISFFLQRDLPLSLRGKARLKPRNVATSVVVYK